VSIRHLALAAVVAACLGALPPRLRRSAAWDRQAVYAAREAQLKKAIEARLADPNPLLELAAFYLKPVAPRDVEAADGVQRRVMVPVRNEWIVDGIKQIYAVPWVFRGDPAAARPLLKRARHPARHAHQGQTRHLQGNPRPLGGRRHDTGGPHAQKPGAEAAI